MRKLKHKYGIFMLSIVAVFLYSHLSYAGGNLLQLNGSGGHDSVVWQDFQLPITWHLSEDGLPNSGVTITELENTLKLAFQQWAGAGLSGLNYTYGGLVPERHVGIDGINLITFTDNDYLFPEYVAAFAINYTFVQDVLVGDTNNDLNNDGVPDLINGLYPAGTVYEADIVFNASLGFANSGLDSTLDIRAVATHEIGHVIGLSHSIVQDTVMHPFLSPDISSARSLKEDDLAYEGYLYAPSYMASNYGAISGFITNGFDGQPIVGAHVYAVNKTTGKIVVGSYSLESGDYYIPGLRGGEYYYVGIEPLDGEPLEADPTRINEVIKNTTDINFIPEFYDENESNIESDSSAAKSFYVSPFSGTSYTNINIVTNTASLPGITTVVKPGLNLFSYPVATLIGFTAYDLLQAIGNDSEVNSIDRYNQDTGRFERALWSNGELTGVNFDIQRGEGYLLYMQVQKSLVFEGQQNCPLISVTKGFNLVGVPCPPAGYSAFDLLESIGPSATSVKHYNVDTMDFQVASFDSAGNPIGDDFVITNGISYVIETLSDQNDVSLPGPQQIFAPFILAVSPGRGVIGEQVMFTGQGFSDDLIGNEVKFNGVSALVNYASGNQIIATVPSGATTGPVTVAVAGKLSNAVDFIIEPSVINETDLQGKDLVQGQVVQGNLDSNSEQDRYSFIASKDSIITATAASVISGVPDLMLFLEGPSGEILASDDNSAGLTNAKIDHFKINRTGRYTLVVAAKPDTGIGAYTLELEIDGTQSVSEIAILDGDYQTGVMGTQLVSPLEVLVTGSNGAPMAGVPVSVNTNDADNIDISKAATYQYVTNSSGIVTISMTLPNAPGTFDIIIDIPSIPGYTPKTIKAASVASLPVDVVVEGNGQDCGGNGCPATLPLPNPYKLRYLDSSGLPVAGVITKFSVVSGDGILVSSSGVTELSKTSDAAGEVSVTHILGQKVYTESGVRIPQIVAVTGINPGSELLLFESIASAGNATTITSRRTPSIRLTMGSAKFNTIHVKVTDEFGNAVVGQELIQTDVNQSGLIISAYINGVLSSTLETDENGEFIGVLIADFQGVLKDVINIKTGNSVVGVISYGDTGVAPTYDEFGLRATVAGTGEPIPPHQVSLAIPGVTEDVTYFVDVDMGPSLLLIDQGVGLQQGTKQWVGKDTEKPIIMMMTSYQRSDECSVDIRTSIGDGEVLTDTDDQGDWRDEDFSLSRIRAYSYVGVTVDYSASRSDNLAGDAPGLSATTVTTQDTGTGSAVNITSWTAPVTVTMTNAQGGINVQATTHAYDNIYWRDDVCLENGTPLYMGLQGPLLSTIQWPPMNNFLTLQSVSPQIEVIVNDQFLSEPNPNPFPTLASHSGIDLSTLNVSLNANSILSNSNLPVLNKNPNYIEVFADGLSINTIDSGFLQTATPTEFRFIYYPTASELNSASSNTVDVSGLKDHVGNTAPNFQQTFTAP